MEQIIENFSTILDDAAKVANPVIQISNTSKITLNQAYEIQALSIQRRLARGENLTGLKMGFTSKAKMEQMGVHDMIWGRLTNNMHFENEGDIPMNKFIHPRAEPEIAFLLKKDITSNITINEVESYIDGLAPAIEIIDSRYKNFKFSLEDVIADNCSSSGYVLGKWYSPDTDVSNIEITIGTNGEVKAIGNSKAILDNPFQSLVEAVRLALKYGQELKKGMVILAGAATSAIPVNDGDTVQATFGNLGSLSFQAK
ncbi:2-keto-4-pentenoate hydratase [Seonamhaeicola maritimus]|uniref:4-oxalocrotonate decarboxylase n=1 Tax=Seonamhaeicola maritimus TaxID=2591822 RepID=A0A5C7GDV0_9FLAO|nr:fumarylacetoacetate hydrolase family protein [Seonamhaeicola maritimus]TXG34692.1 4-oxalocrotonate decarboxylase [Seonamhaeicola maritimus]